MKDFTSTALTAAAIAVAVPLVLRLLVRRSPLAPGELRYSRGFRWFSALMATVPTVGFGLLAALAPRSKAPGETVAMVSVLLAFPALALPLVLEGFRVVHRFDEQGLAYRSPWSARRRLEWSRVTRVRWRKMMKWLDFEVGGEVFHFSPMIGGLEAFADVALRQVPAEVIEPSARAALEQMRAGQSVALLLEP